MRSSRIDLLDLGFTLISGAIWMTWPQVGGWPLLIALFIGILRIANGEAPFRRTRLDPFIALFLITATLSAFSAYDAEAAWSKFWLIVASVLLYYTISRQPRQNLVWVCGIFFALGIGLAGYFLLTHDFIANPRRIELVNSFGAWLMNIRPQVAWPVIHPNYISGLAIISLILMVYPLAATKRPQQFWYLLRPGVFSLGALVILFAVALTTSRGALLAFVSGIGFWFMWQIGFSGKLPLRLPERAFPWFVLLGLTALVAVLYLGPARTGSDPTLFAFGNGSRLELFTRSLDLLVDFPFTGGGLGSFPGLYSTYILNIPIYYVPNSHNLFLDVAIEQGPLAGVAFFLMYLVSIWWVANEITHHHPREQAVFNWLVLVVLVFAFVHGMVDNYLYNAKGSLLALVLVALAANSFGESLRADQKVSKPSRAPVSLARGLQENRFTLPIFGLVLIFLALFFFRFNDIRSAWHANQGAVEMAKVELAGFPTNAWAGPPMAAQLGAAEQSFQQALQHNPYNRTANYRLGAIAMLEHNFDSARAYLEIAYQAAPHHRGIIKMLGYCYVWLNELDRAESLLVQIPESKDELDVYSWWWSEQGRSTLSAQAKTMISKLSESDLTK